MKYGIICAVPEEIALVSADIAAERATKLARRDFLEGTLYGHEVVLAQSEVGKVAAAITATLMIERFGVEAIIFCGTAGGVDPALNVGDVVVADRLVQHDVYDGEDFFIIPRLDVAYFAADQALSERMHAAIDAYLRDGLHRDIPQKHLDEFHIRDPKVMVGTIASGDQFINDSAKRIWLEEHVENLKCVEMEGAAVAQVCHEFGLPIAVIRVISDSSNEESGPAFDKFAAEAMCYFTRGSLRAFMEAL